ncbi:MAG: hypothetical protein AAGK04_05600, partial [Planctomycetota bacterium]
MTGEMRWFWESPPALDEALFDALLRSIDVDGLMQNASRADVQRAWDEFRRNRDQVDDVEEDSNFATANEGTMISHPADDAYRLIGADLSSQDVLAEVNNVSLVLCTVHAELIHRVRDQCESLIPIEVRGAMTPMDFFIEIGRADVFEAMENDDGTLFGVSRLSVCMTLHAWPRDWATCRRQFLELPVVNEIGERLEAVLGPAKRAIYWG